MDSCMRPEAKKAKRWVTPFFLFFVLSFLFYFYILFLFFNCIQKLKKIRHIIKRGSKIQILIRIIYYIIIKYLFLRIAPLI